MTKNVAREILCRVSVANIKAHIKETIKTNRKWRDLCYEVIARVESGGYDRTAWARELKNAIFYYGHKLKEFDPYEAWAFAHIRALIGEGKLLTAALRIGEQPCADKNINDNQKILDRFAEKAKEQWGLEILGTVKPLNGRGDCNDGQIDINSRIYFAKADWIRQKVREVELNPPIKMPLEIGSTSAIRSWQHILQSGALARWSYESKNMILFWLAA